MGRRPRSSYIHPHEILLETELSVSVTGSAGAETPVTVTLTQEKIILTSRSQRPAGIKCLGKSQDVAEIISSDIVSVRPPYHGENSRSSNKKKILQPVFLVVAYPRIGKIREKKFFYFQLSGRREEAHQLSQIWVTAVSDICLGLQRSSLGPLYSVLPASQPLLVLINPASGKGGALRAWHQAKCVLSEAGRLVEVIVTEGQGHASQIMASLDLSLWGGVVTVSGDGLLYEVFNGLLVRPDWRSALQFSVGVLPGGSGNALVHTLAASQGDRDEEDGGLMSMALSIARGHVTPMDLFLVRGPGPEIRVGFISFGWGLITDVDIESETLRGLGSVRFTVYALLKVAKHKLYRGTISYVLADWPDRQNTKIMKVPIHPLDSEESDWTQSSLGNNTSMGQVLMPGYHVSHVAHIPPVRHVTSYADSWQELDQRLCTVNFVAGGHGGGQYSPSSSGGHAPCGGPPVTESSKIKAAYPQKYFSQNNNQRRSSSHSHRDSASRSRSSSSPEKSRSRSRTRSRSSPEKKKKSSRGIQKKLQPPPDTPLSATPTCIPPIAPPPVFPNAAKSPAQSPGPDPCDPTQSPLTATPLHKDWVSETANFLSVMVLNVPYLNR